MKHLLLFVLFTSVNICTAQNSDSYFKTTPSNTIDLPEWAQLMYAEDPNVKEVSFKYDLFYKENSFEKNIHTQNFKYWIRNVEEHIDAEGKIRPISNEEYQQKVDAVYNQRFKSSSQKSAGTWESIGPFQTFNESEQGNFPVSWQGNIYSFDQSQSDPNLLFAGSEAGGVFKSVDKGLNWQFTSSEIPVATIWDVKIAPSNSNIVYIIANQRVYKSTDQGVSWEDVYFLSGTAYQIQIDQLDPNTCYIAGENGLHVTRDGGLQWSRTIDSKCWDVKQKPNDSNVLYVVQPNQTSNQSIFLKSTDAGENWTTITDGWYTAEDPNNSIDQGARIAVTKADPEYVYVALLGESKAGDVGWIGLYKSTNSGDQWNNPNLPDGGPYNNDSHQNLATINRDGTGFHQGFYNFSIAASDKDPERLWVGCLSLSQSENGGQSWKRIGSYNAQDDIGWIHPDIQDLHVLNDDVWVCTDGGINYSMDELITHESRVKGLYASDYWGFGQGWNQDVMVGGRYHNGNSGYYETYGVGNALRLGGAEAATGYVNPLKERKAYFSDISTKIIPKTIDGPTTALSPLGLYPNETYSNSYSSELLFDPRYSDHIYMGKDDKIWKSINEGGQFFAIYEFDQPGRVLEIEQSRSNPDVFYCVYQIGGGYWDDCNLFKSIDGGISWERITDVPTNDTWRMEISINPEDENELWVIAINAFSSQLVYNTTDGGNTWDNKSKTILDGHTPSDIKYQAGTDQVVYLSTDLGMFHWSKVEQDWVDCSEGLPLLTRAMEVEPFYRDSKLRMATWGRGLYESDLVTASNPIAQPMTTSDIIYCNRDTIQFDCYSVLDHDGASWNWSFDPEPIYVSDKNARNPRAVFQENGSYDVTLEVIDGHDNSSSNTIEKMVTVDNRCAVDTFPGSVLACNQVGDYVATPNLDLFTNEMTFTAWIKPNGIQPEYTGIVMNNGDAAGLNFRPNMELGYHWPGGAWWYSSGLFVPEDEWSYVAIVAKPDEVTVYLNGVGATHTTQLEEINISSLLIGSYKGWDSRNFNGLIDEVCVWSRALSQNEIRELRHLTKDGITDPNFIAYYQFNEEGLPRVLDKVSDFHASLNGNSSIDPNPKVPVAKGTSERKTIESAGAFDFGNAGVSFVLPDNALYPNGEVVATRLHSAPQPNFFSEPSSNCYWIINNYGSDVYGPISNLKLETVSDLSSTFVGSPQSGQLYNQGENDDENFWENKCSAISTENNFVAFQDNCVESAEGQFYLVSSDSEIQIIGNVMVDTKETVANEIRVYPNPVIQNGQVYFENPSNEKLRFKLYNTEGKLVADKILQSQTMQVPKELNAGLYYYQLETNNYIRSGKLIIQ